MRKEKEAVLETTEELYDKKANYAVYVTNDYDRFKFLDGNRNVESIKQLKESIKRFGYLPVPILVNGDFFIIDGQHRVVVCRELGLPIYYIVANNISLSECVSLNIGRKNWSIKNYVHAYATTSEDYVRFELLMQQFPVYTSDVIYTAMHKNLTGGGTAGIIKSKKLTCSVDEYEHARKVLTWLNTFQDDIKDARLGGSISNLYVALIFAYHSKSTSKSELTSRLHRYFARYQRVIGSTQDAIEKTNDIYNYKRNMAKTIDLVSEYRMAVKEGMLKCLKG